MTCPFFLGKFCDGISPKLEELLDSTFIMIMAHAKFHFNWLNVNLDFWHPGLSVIPPPPRALRTTKRSGLIGLNDQKFPFLG